MWSATLPDAYAGRKCRYRVAALLNGVGIDLGANEEKIVPGAIGLGYTKEAEINVDLSANDALGVFADCSMDYVFDAHQLGNLKATKGAVYEWWRVVKQGGYLVLYEQDKDYYPHVGTPGCGDFRKKDLYWEDVWEILKDQGAEIVSSSRHNDSNEYSWQLVLRKTHGTSLKESQQEKRKYGEMCFPRKKVTNKEVLVIRYGALGDTCWITPALSQLKKDGYHVVFSCTDYNAQVVKNDPNIDEFHIIHKASDVPYEQLNSMWEEIGSGFEKVINLTQTIEGELVKCEGSDEFNWPHEKRHEVCNVNYQDRTMEMCGYPEMKGCLPELHFTEFEKETAGVWRNERKDKFVVLWGLAGSAFHKVYPWSEYIATELCGAHKDIEVVTVGDEASRILEWHNSRTVNKSGVLSVRQSFLLTKYADLVIGPDTGLLNAAAAFPTPKIVMMSAGSKENLTKYWENTDTLFAEDCECYPCHRLIYSNNCPKGSIQGVAPKCMEDLKPELVMEAIMRRYSKWKDIQVERKNKKRLAAFTIYDDDLTLRLAKRVKASFEKFHGGIPFYMYDARDENSLLGEVRESACACKAFEIRPRLHSKLLDDFDIVIYLDADTVVCDTLHEFLDDDYDVAGSLNIGNNGYLNAGVNAISNKAFCDEWTELMYKGDSGPSNQVYFNQLARCGRFNLKIVDEKDVYYNEKSREHWKDLKLTGSGLRCNDRAVRVLHWAGGVSRMEDKLSSSDFNDDVRKVLDRFTDTTDFTENVGQEVSAWT